MCQFWFLEGPSAFHSTLQRPQLQSHDGACTKRRHSDAPPLVFLARLLQSVVEERQLEKTPVKKDENAAARRHGTLISA